MRKLIIILNTLVFIIPVEGQVYHSCRNHNQSITGYENQLNEKWLSAYDVKFYDLNLSVSNVNTNIAGSAAILIEAVREMDTLVIQLQDALEVTRIGISHETTPPEFKELSEFNHLEHAVYISLAQTRRAGDQFYILIEYEGEARQEGGFFTGVKSATDPTYGFDVTYTLSEPHNAKDWFPVKQVLEDKIDSAWISLHCDDHLMAGSNGLLVEIVPGEKNTHTFRWRTRYPVAYYLLSFTVANYRDFSFKAALSEEGDSVLVQNFIYDSDNLFLQWEDEILETGSMITNLSCLLKDYPFSEEKYGHAMAPMGGGMEHQTMTTLHNFNFHLVAHELAHQWFGDYITCGNWQDIWINEGFASYMEYVIDQQLRGQESANKWMANAISIALAETEGSVYVPEESVEDAYRLFDYGLTYKKGAILLHMIRYQLDNDDLFFGILRTYLNQFGNGFARGEDFRMILESKSGIDFSCFFDQWYYGEGYPRFNVQWFQQGDSLMITSEQISSASTVTPLFNTPFDLEILHTDGTLRRIRLKQDEQINKFAVAVEGLVSALFFDPDNWLLKSASVIHQMPGNRFYTFGPNPVKDELYVQFINTAFIDEIKITNMSGQEVFRNLYAENPAVVDLSNLTDGPYLLVINESDRTYMERIVKVSGN